MKKETIAAWNRVVESMAVKDDPESITTSEFSAMMGVSINTAKRRLREMVTKGIATAAMKRVDGADGKRYIVRSYKLVKKGERK